MKEGGSHGSVRALVLGVTPEYARLDWPAGTDLLAVDRSEVMLRAVWPGFPAPGQGALHADWVEAELPPGSRDLVLGDGCFTLLPFPEGHRALLRKVSGMLSPDGRFALRAFVPPAVPETPAAVYEAALAEQIRGFHAFKLRLLLAHQRDPRQGVPVQRVWRSWVDGGPGPEALEALGWPRAQIDTFASYARSTAVHTFPDLDAIRALAAAEGFREVDCTTGTYELAACCPTMVLAPRGGAR